MAQVYPEKSFKCVGSDLHSTVRVSYTDAILGGKMDVPTLRGTVTVQIQPGIQHNTILRLRNQGMPVSGAGAPAFGHHYITVRLLIPGPCTQGEQRLLGQIKNMANSTAAVVDQIDVIS